MALKAEEKEGLKKNIGFSAIGSVGTQVISILGFVFLARLLSPYEFGLMAMVVIFTSLATIFIEVGMGAALIHNQDATIEHESTAFWFNMTVSILLLLVIDAGSGLISSFFHAPELQDIVMYVSLLLPLNALAIVPMAMLQKAHNFRMIAIIELSALFCGTVVALALAFYGFGVWALVVNLLLAAFVRDCLLFACTGWRPKQLFNRGRLRELWGYSGYLLGSSFVNYCVESADKILIGKLLSGSTLGAYDNACRLILLPVNLISNIVNRVMFPFYASAQDPSVKKKVHLKMIRMVFFLVLPLLLVTGVLSDMLVLSILGEKWREMIHIIEMLSVIYILRSVSSLNGPVYLSEGATPLLFKLTLLFRGNVLIATLIGIYVGGLNGLLWGLLIARIINFFPALYFPGRLIGIHMREYFFAMVYTVVSALSTMMVVLMAKHYIHYDVYSVLHLLMFSGFAIVLYVAFSLLINQKGSAEIYNLRPFRRYK